MIVSIHTRQLAGHQIEAAAALSKGIELHGDTVIHGKYNEHIFSDVKLIWSWKQNKLIRQTQKNNESIVVMELGFFPPRDEWVSLTIDGMNGKGFCPPATDNGARFWENFGHLLKPWRKNSKGVALVIGQVPGDSSLAGSNINVWTQRATANLVEKGWKVIYREHPFIESQPGWKFVPQGAEKSILSLEEDLARAGLVVTYCSNTAIESVLAGIPTITFSDMSVAYPVTSHNFDQPFQRPDRAEWCANMAFRQWKTSELEDGTAWGFIRPTLLAKRNSVKQ